MHSALSPGEQKSCGHDGDTRGEGVPFFQSGVDAAAQRTQEKEKADRRPPSETTFETLDLVNKPVVFWTPVEEENADERMWEFRSEDR